MFRCRKRQQFCWPGLRRFWHIALRLRTQQPLKFTQFWEGECLVQTMSSELRQPCCSCVVTIELVRDIILLHMLFVNATNQFADI